MKVSPGASGAVRKGSVGSAVAWGRLKDSSPLQGGAGDGILPPGLVGLRGTLLSSVVRGQELGTGNLEEKQFYLGDAAGDGRGVAAPEEASGAA